jgi:hypothetical membrane protein
VPTRASGTEVAGALLIAAGCTILMGIITAEVVYPGDYATDENTISDLGVTTESPDHRAATIFNGAMIASGAATMAAAGLLHRSLRTLFVTVPGCTLRRR